MAEASYPSDLTYHEEHDWARIDGDVATFGITWYAQDQLGEVVFFDPPEVGATVRKGDPYAEVESVKAVSDVIAPLSGEIVEVNEALSSSPGGDQRRPLRGRLDGQGAPLGPVRGRRPDGRRRLPGALELKAMTRYTSATDDDRRAMLAAIGADSIDALFADVPEAVRLDRPLDLPAGKPEQEVYGYLRDLAAQNVSARTRSRSSAPACTTTTCRR